MGNGVLAFETSNPIKSRARGLEQAARVDRWKIPDGCNGEFPLRWRMEGVGAARRGARLIYNTKGNCGIIPRSQGARPAEMSVKSASRRTPARPATRHYQFARVRPDCA